MATKRSAAYQRIKKFLGDSFKESDDELILIYCETYEFYTRLRREVSSNDLLVTHTNKSGATNLVKNPLAIELTKTVQTLNNLLKSLGLTAAQRKKLVTDGGGKNGRDGDFDNF